jgi:hypothetical protein
MCNCRGNNIAKPTPVPIVVPEPPKETEVDHFNNIDTIEPIDNGQTE